MHQIACGWLDAAVTASVTSTKLNYTSSLVSTGIGDDRWRVYHPNIYPGHPGPLSLAIPPWVGVTSAGDGFGCLPGKKRRIRSYDPTWRLMNQFVNKNNIELDSWRLSACLLVRLCLES